MNNSTNNDEFKVIGNNLKRLRSQKNLSLSEAADLTGVSKTMLSQIERSQSTPTISTIWKIANGLKVKFDTLLGSNISELCEIRNVEDIVPLRDKSHRAEIYCMVPFSPITGYEFFYAVFHPGCDYFSYHKNSRSELIFVYQGELELVVGSDTYHIKAGSTVSFDASIVHRYINNGSEDIKLCSLVSYE